MSLAGTTRTRLAGHPPPDYSVPPVQRAFKLLRHIAAGDPAANMSVTARAVGLSRTTLIRLIATLESEGMIERRPDGPGYRLGLGLVGLAGKALYASDLAQVGESVIEGLARQLSLSAHIGVLDGRDVLYIARRTPNVHLVSNVGIGSRLPAHATTMGRVLLADMDADELAALYDGVALQRFTDKTPTTFAALLEQREADIASGLAWSDSNFDVGISSVAAAIFDRSGRAVAALNVTGPTASFGGHPGRRLAIGEAVVAAAAALSARLGHAVHDGGPKTPPQS
jgi:DNA-binding IclR family transcriptional regulator